MCWNEEEISNREKRKRHSHSSLRGDGGEIKAGNERDLSLADKEVNSLTSDASHCGATRTTLILLLSGSFCFSA